MVIQPVSNLHVGSTDLSALQADDDVGGQPVHHVTKIGLVLGDVAVNQIGIPVVLLSAVQVERQARGDRHSHLRPSAITPNRYQIPIRQCGETLPQRAYSCHLSSMEKHS